MYERVPTILRPDEILDKILGRSAKIRVPERRADKRFKKTAQARTESMRDLLVETLNGYVKAFPNLDRVDTYERELVEVLVGVGPLRQALARLSGATRAASSWCDQALGEMKRIRDEDELKRIRRRLIGRLSGLVEDLTEPLAFLASARATFRKIPEVSPGDTTIVVAGYPNVGKSSLVAALSDARPEIAPYAFTTKHANVGHFLEPGKDELHARRFQVVDTPGLLEKPPSQRNAIETQAALALRHLADLILFVMDRTETCGYTLTDQERLLDAVRQEFAGTPLIVVASKADLDAERKDPDEDALLVSATRGTGIEQLRARLVDSSPEDPFASRLAREEIPDWSPEN